ncbi:MAG: hypothetical protein IK117_00240 [Bacteroidales bacterium]|nr:hypothetical protein [Bacteroidales bacterium]
MSTPDYSALQTALKGSTLWANSMKSTESVMDVVLKGSALSAALSAPSKWSLNPFEVGEFSLEAATKNALSPSLTALAAMEAQTSLLTRNGEIKSLTSIATQIASITDVLVSQSDYVRQLIAPTSMLADLQRVAEQTHKTIADAGKLIPWQLGVLDTVSLMADRQVDWASRISSTAYSDYPFSPTESLNDLYPKINVIEVLPEELEYEKTQEEGITPSEALGKTPAFRFSERAKALIERVTTINQICKRTNRKPIFTFSDTTMMAAVTLGGTECVNRSSFGDVIDSLYFIFYENIEHIKSLVTEESVVNEDVYQCIFRVKDMRTDVRHDIEHGGKSKIKKKNKDIGESYSHYTGKVALTSKSDYRKTQAGLYDDFKTLTDHLLGIVEKQG